MRLHLDALPADVLFSIASRHVPSLAALVSASKASLAPVFPPRPLSSDLAPEPYFTLKEVPTSVPESVLTPISA